MLADIPRVKLDTVGNGYEWCDIFFPKELVYHSVRGARICCTQGQMKATRASSRRVARETRFLLCFLQRARSLRTTYMLPHVTCYASTFLMTCTASPPSRTYMQICRSLFSKNGRLHQSSRRTTRLPTCDCIYW